MVLSSVACYRATGIPKNQVSAYQATAENTDVLPSGLDSTNRIGDFVLQSSNLQLVFDGDLVSTNRHIFGVHSGGAIIDACTRYVDVFSRLQTRADDGMNLISQGVNLNSGTPIVYAEIQVEEIDEVNAGILLVGHIYDYDGSLRASGAQVDAATQRVLDCTVTTRLSLSDSRDVEVEATEEGEENTTVSVPVQYVTITSVVQNHSMVNLPVFSVHDHVVTTAAATDVFIPFPGFGFSRTLGASGISDIAYPPYVSLQARQSDTAQYGWISQMDGLLSATIQTDAIQRLEHTYIGKVGKRDEIIPPGGELSFIRELWVVSNANTAEHMYDAMVAMLQDSDSPLNIFENTGEFRAAFTFESAPAGQTEVHFVDDAQLIYDGSQFQSVSAENSFPIYGDRQMDPFVSLFVPTGKMVLKMDIANSPPRADPWFHQQSFLR